MTHSRTIASIYARRRRLILGLQDFERRAEVYRSTIVELEAELRALVPVVPPFAPRRRCPHFTAREFSRGCHDALRELEGSDPSAEEITSFLMRRKGLDISDVALREAIGRRVRGTLRRMARPGGPAPKPKTAASSRRNRPKVCSASPV